jgi:hypothetical protein
MYQILKESEFPLSLQRNLVAGTVHELADIEIQKKFGAEGVLCTVASLANLVRCCSCLHCSTVKGMSIVDASMRDGCARFISRCKNVKCNVYHVWNANGNSTPDSIRVGSADSFAIACARAGCTWEQVHQLLVAMNVACPKERSFYRHQVHWIIAVIDAVRPRQEALLIQAIKDARPSLLFTHAFCFLVLQYTCTYIAFCFTAFAFNRDQ